MSQGCLWANVEDIQLMSLESQGRSEKLFVLTRAGWMRPTNERVGFFGYGFGTKKVMSPSGADTTKVRLELLVKWG